MRSHQTIVTDFGASKMHRALKELGRELAIGTPQRWAERDRIPAEWWPDVVIIGAASREELLASQRPRKRPEPKDRAKAAA
jgi:hypothetical protein